MFFSRGALTRLLLPVPLLVLGLCIVSRPASAAPILSLIPSSPVVGLGDLLSVAVTVDGLGAGAAPSLGSYDVTIAFDPALLSFMSVVYGDPVLGNQLNLGGFGSLQFTTAGAGSLMLTEISLDSIADLNAMQAGTFTLATAQFLAIGTGSSSFSISSLRLGDAFGDGAAASASASRFALDILPNPEPSALLLLATGLAAAFAFRRKR